MSGLRPNTDQRLDHLDVLRGFALLGILMVNFQWFSRPVQAIVTGADPGLHGADLAVDLGVSVLFEGKFYAIFSMLFGAGFALLAQRAGEAGTGFTGLYLRRILVLAAFGLAHIALAWSGDILFVYALVAFVMVLLFGRTPTRRLWKWAIVFIALPSLLMAVLTGLVWLAQFNPEAAAGMQAQFAEQARQQSAALGAAEAVHREGGFTAVMAQRFADLRFMLGMAPFWVPPVLGFFLLGRWLLSSGRLGDPAAHAAWFRRWQAIGLGLGLPLSALGAWRIHGLDLDVPTPALVPAQLMFASGAALLALGYLTTVVRSARALGWLAPVGRMALTNYLLQSTVWSLVFNGYGLGLWGEVPRAWHPLLALGFFALQVPLSHWWMARFRFGPAEWVWRSLTYLSPQPMRR